MRPCRASLSIPLLVLLPLPAAAEDGVSAPPLAVGGVLLLVGLLAWGLGRHAAAIRADFVRLAAEAPPADRLAAFRDAPGGLPEGSIRAALAFFIVLLCLPALVLSRALGLAGTGELGTILGGVIGFYFGTRSAGGEAEGARRQAEAAQAGRALAEQDAAAARAEGAAAHQEAATRARDAATATEGLSRLAAAAAAGTAVARAVAALLPGPAGAALNGAAGAIPAVQAAIEHPTPERIAAAARAAAEALSAAGQGNELATRLQGALETARHAAEAAGALRDAAADPSPERFATALARAGQVAGDGGLGGVLTPLLAALAPLAAVVPPAGIAGAVLLGAWQAASVGRTHYLRWMARVLDRPVSRDLFPGGAWDGEAARALIGEVPSLARALSAALAPEASQEEAAAALSRLLDPGAGALLFAEHGSAFASATEAEAAVAALRRVMLETELDRADTRPAGALSQAALRTELDRLREAGAGGAIDTLALLAEGLIGRDGVGDFPALVTRALTEAAS